MNKYDLSKRNEETHPASMLVRCVFLLPDKGDFLCEKLSFLDTITRYCDILNSYY